MVSQGSRSVKLATVPDHCGITGKGVKGATLTKGWHKWAPLSWTVQAVYSYEKNFPHVSMPIVYRSGPLIGKVFYVWVEVQKLHQRASLTIQSEEFQI